jgi:hypothetical protein
MNNPVPPAVPRQSLGYLPFVIGGASFFPLLGVPLGLIAIIWGLATNRKGRLALVLLGTGGILFTVVLYGSLFYFGFVKRGGIYDELRAKLAATNLQSLAKEIEFHKLQKGTYPATLEELLPRKKDSYVMIYDPTQMRLGSMNPVPFYYELQPDKEHYYLLSIGPDQVPFTADDIVPPFSPEELAKMGLRIKKEGGPAGLSARIDGGR